MPTPAESYKRRALRMATALRLGDTNVLGTRAYDDCCEMGDGQLVIERVVRILARHHIHSFDQLPQVSKRYAGREWFPSQPVEGIHANV